MVDEIAAGVGAFGPLVMDAIIARDGFDLFGRASESDEAGVEGLRVFSGGSAASGALSFIRGD